ncbi:MAG: T9SS type A sorting domain-containing protein [Bacteroidia bacterium]|nr:T9SS type A sorting domain-containing protein [Bacteroidia bacterium]
MKRKLISLVLGVCATAIIANAQCVSTFPYTYDFENFDSLQSQSSCDLAFKGDTSDGWLQDLSDQGDWRADSAGTPSVGTGPGSTATTNGVGVGKDYSPGTTAGTYLYVESSGTCTFSEINLLSPCFDFSGKSYYQLEFAYHMYGGSMGSLSIDVYDGTDWVNDVWKTTGSQDTAWKIAKVGLAQFNTSSVQIRFRAVTGASFTSDVAIDAIKIDTYTPLDYDALVFDVSLKQNKDGYYYVPKGHISDSIAYNMEVRNSGIKSITNVKVYGEVNSGKDTVDIGTMTAHQRDTLTNEFMYWPKNGDEDLSLRIGLTETDGNTSNNSVKIETGLNDTVYSRDDGVYVGGVGANTGTVEIGNVYELFTDDTLTSVSFFTNGGNAGDSVRVHLYNYSGTPGSVISSSDPIVMDGTARWYTTKVGCDQALSKGDYFVTVEQLVANSNMGLGYDNKFYRPNVCKYSGAGWPQLNLAGGEVALIRINFGPTRYPQITVDLDDSICNNQQYIVEVEGASTYEWEPFGIVSSKTGNIVKVQSDKNFTLKVTGTNTCGVKGVLEMPVVVKAVPKLIVSNDTTICEKEKVTLKAKTGSDYRWVGGTTNGDYDVSPTSTTTYSVIADSSNGCSTEKNVVVTISKPVPSVNNDTTVCEAQPIELLASGGATYQWTGGPNTAKYTVNPRTDQMYIVEVIDAFKCSAFDTVNVMVTKGPNLSTSNDTAVCFGNRVNLMAYGADSYEWIGGPKTANYNALPISSNTYYVKGEGSNGCYLIDSVQVTVARIPTVELRNDTNICEGQGLDLKAETADDVDFEWNSGQKTQTISVAPKVTTMYKVVVKNSVGCSREDSVRVLVDPLPTLDFNLTQTHKNISILNYSDHGDSHLWKFGDGDSSTDKSTTHRYAVHGSYTLTYTITNKCGSKDTSLIIDVENLSVKDQGFDEFQIYPNPTSGLVWVALTNSDYGAVTTVVTDINGRVLHTYVGEKSSTGYVHNLDLGNFASGTYLIHVSSSSGNAVRRINVK